MLFERFESTPCCTLITGVVIDLCRCCHSYCTVYHLLFYVRVRVTMLTVFYHLCDIYFACFLAWQDKHHPGESLIYAWPRFTCFYFFLSVMFILFCSFGLLFSYLFYVHFDIPVNIDILIFKFAWNTLLEITCIKSLPCLLK